MDRSLIDHARSIGSKGLVIEAFGAGNVPPTVVEALEECVTDGIPVVLATRCIEGGVWPIYGYPGGGADLVEKGVIPCGRLGGPKARIRLICALGLTTDMAALRQIFSEAQQPVAVKRRNSAKATDMPLMRSISQTFREDDLPQWFAKAKTKCHGCAVNPLHPSNPGPVPNPVKRKFYPIARFYHTFIDISGVARKPVLGCSRSRSWPVKPG
eukprot:TRINITY_DN29445_c0_g1_i1.p2 TRINITY_DN29445_c0_g1~~TRINITY_DN29445_c0_g1_i1.p2  ORF type:complete len:212 (-),score=41.42 TRINITY_DN29445_c0_g1_i1:86-721(-)